METQQIQAVGRCYIGCICLGRSWVQFPAWMLATALRSLEVIATPKKHPRADREMQIPDMKMPQHQLCKSGGRGFESCQNHSSHKISLKEHLRWISRAPLTTLFTPVTANRVFIRRNNHVLNHTFSCLYQAYLVGPRRDQLHSWRFMSNKIKPHLVSVTEAQSLFKVYPHRKSSSDPILIKLFLMFLILLLTLLAFLYRGLLCLLV